MQEGIYFSENLAVIRIYIIIIILHLSLQFENLVVFRHGSGLGRNYYQYLFSDVIFYKFYPFLLWSTYLFAMNNNFCGYNALSSPILSPCPHHLSRLLIASAIFSITVIY